MIAFDNNNNNNNKGKIYLKTQNQKVWSMKFNSILFIFYSGMHQLKVEF